MKHLIIVIISVCAAALTISMCRSWGAVEKHSYGDECRHCHGEHLQGVQNVRDGCSECHEPLKMKPEDMKVQERIDAVFNGAHVHKTDNIFKSTPSCFYCHRRTDF